MRVVVLAGFTVLLLTWMVWENLRAKNVEHAVDRFVGSYELADSEPLRVALTQRFRWEARAELVCLVPYVLFLTFALSWSASWFVLLLGLLLASMLLRRVVSLRLGQGLPGRVASPVGHRREVGVDDYVPPVLRRVAAGSVGVLIVATVIALAVLHRPVLVGVGAAVAALAAAGAEVAVRRIVGSPEPAAGPEEVFVRDALRSLHLGALYRGEAVFGLWLSLCVVAWKGIDDDLSVLWMLLFLGLALVVGGSLKDDKRRFRERLWQDRPMAALA